MVSYNCGLGMFVLQTHQDREYIDSIYGGLIHERRPSWVVPRLGIAAYPWVVSIPEATETIRTDARGRMSIGRPNETFLATTTSDGAIVLEPAVTVPTIEARLLANDEIQERLTRAHRGEGLVSRRAGRRRAAGHQTR